MRLSMELLHNESARKKKKKKLLLFIMALAMIKSDVTIGAAH